MIIYKVILLTFAFICFTAVIDAEHLNDKDYIEDHESRSFQRLTFFITMGLIEYHYFVASGLLFAAFFDQVLNLLRGLPLLHLGNTAKWDKFFNKRKWLYVIVKLLALFGSIYVFTYG